MRRLAAFMLIAAAVHAAVPASYAGAKAAYPHVRRFGEEQVEHIRGRVNSLEIRFERQKLVNEARGQLERGEFRMGEFLLRVGELDAQERGERPDVREARSRYNRLLGELRGRLEGGQRVQEAIPEIFSDTRYYGHSEGGMLELLLNNGGSCVPISYTVASLVYDAGGHEDDIFLRSYPPNANGYGHMAPVLGDGGEFFDLVRGNYAYRGGMQSPATSVIELYAMNHWLLDMRLGGASHGSLPSGVDMGEGTFPGGAPMFAAKAFRPFNLTPPTTVLPDGRLPSATYWPQLDVMELLRETWASMASEPAEHAGTLIIPVSLVETRQQPRGDGTAPLRQIETDVERMSRAADDAEVWLRLTPEDDAGRRVLLLAYLTGIYGMIEDRLGDQAVPPEYAAVADSAARRRQAARLEGGRLLENVDFSTDAGLEFFDEADAARNDSYYKLELRELALLGEEADDALLALLNPSEGGTHNFEFPFNLGPSVSGGNADILEILLSRPSARERAMERLSALPENQQAGIIRHISNDARFRSAMAAMDAMDAGPEFHRAYLAYQSLRENPDMQALFSRDTVRHVSCNGCNTERGMVATIEETAPMHAIGFDQMRRTIRQTAARYGLDDEWENAFTALIGWYEVAHGGLRLAPANTMVRDYFPCDLLPMMHRERGDYAAYHEAYLQFARGYRAFLETCPRFDEREQLLDAVIRMMPTCD